jgi:hypothetical protein
MKTITFSGYQWNVRATGTGGPGPKIPNLWDDANAWVDDKGSLHLKITAVTNAGGNTEWHCVEISSQLRLAFGRYQFQVIGRIDELDPNVVLGLFKYPTPDVGGDGTNEIDIEFAKWGNAKAKNADYVVFPINKPRVPGDNTEFNVVLTGGYSTHRFLWESDRVTFQSLHGHRDDDSNEFEHWLYMPTGGRTDLVPQEPTPVRLNLWLFNATPPGDGAEVEMVISQFRFTPLASL